MAKTSSDDVVEVRISDRANSWNKRALEHLANHQHSFTAGSVAFNSGPVEQVRVGEITNSLNRIALAIVNKSRT